MRGLRESVIAAGLSVVLSYRAVQANDWTGLAWSLAIGAIGFGWMGLGLVRTSREARAGRTEPVAPPTIPFRDDPGLRARVEAGQAHLDDLRSHLHEIQTTKATDRAVSEDGSAEPLGSRRAGPPPRVRRR